MSAGRVKVVNVSQPTTGGAAVCVRALVTAGIEAGMDLTVVCPDEGDLGEALRAQGADWERLPLRRAPGAADLVAVARLRQLLAGADVVHLHSSKAGAVGRMAVHRGSRGPGVAYTPHGWGWYVEGPLAPVYRRVERRLAGRADAIIAVSEADRREGAAVLGPRADRIRIIPNGVDADRFAPEGPVAERDPAPMVVCVGRLSRQKGQDLAVRALARTTTADLRLRIVGDGPDRGALESLAAELGVGDRIEFTGFADPSPHLRAADVVIVPSRWDAQSLCMLESMATGRPVVATAVAGSAAVGDGGIVVPTEDPGALATALDDLLADPARRARQGAAGRATVLARHRLEAMTGTTLDLWRALARGR